jgi:hypothetical protein
MPRFWSSVWRHRSRRRALQHWKRVRGEEHSTRNTLIFCLTAFTIIALLTKRLPCTLTPSAPQAKAYLFSGTSVAPSLTVVVLGETVSDRCRVIKSYSRGLRVRQLGFGSTGRSLQSFIGSRDILGTPVPGVYVISAPFNFEPNEDSGPTRGVID